MPHRAISNSKAVGSCASASELMAHMGFGLCTALCLCRGAVDDSSLCDCRMQDARLLTPASPYDNVLVQANMGFHVEPPGRKLRFLSSRPLLGAMG